MTNASMKGMEDAENFFVPILLDENFTETNS